MTVSRDTYAVSCHTRLVCAHCLCCVRDALMYPAALCPRGLPSPGNPSASLQKREQEKTHTETESHPNQQQHTHTPTHTNTTTALAPQSGRIASSSSRPASYRNPCSREMTSPDPSANSPGTLKITEGLKRTHVEPQNPYSRQQQL